MCADADKIMFEVYREPEGNRRYRVVYFTELDESERDQEIDAAMSGIHFFDGFLRAADREAARTVLGRYVERLNGGGAGTRDELAGLLAPFLTR